MIMKAVSLNLTKSFVFIEPLNGLNQQDSVLKRKTPLHNQIKTSTKNLDWSKYRKLEPENLKGK